MPVPTEGRPLPGILPQPSPSASSTNASANAQRATPRIDGLDQPSDLRSAQPQARVQAQHPYHYSVLAEQLERYRPRSPGSSLSPSSGNEQAPIPPDLDVNSPEYLNEPPLLRCLDAHRRRGRDIYKIYRSSGPLPQDVLDRFAGMVPPPPPPSSGSRLNAIVMATARTPSSIPAPNQAQGSSAPRSSQPANAELTPPRPQVLGRYPNFRNLTIVDYVSLGGGDLVFPEPRRPRAPQVSASQVPTAPQASSAEQT